MFEGGHKVHIAQFFVIKLRIGLVILLGERLSFCFVFFISILSFDISAKNVRVFSVL